MRKISLNESYHHSTASVSEKEQFECWRDLVCDEFIQLNCETSKQGSFHGTISGNKLEKLQITEVSSDPQLVIRSKQQISKSTEREFLLSLQLEEEGSVNQDGRVAKLGPGDFALYDSTRYYELHFEKTFRQLVLQIPYESLAERFLNPENITAKPVSAKTGIGSLTSQFIQSTAARLDHLSLQDKRVVTEHIIDMIVLSMGSMSTLRDTDGQSIARTAMLERIKQYIEVNIRNPHLTPTLIARQHQISDRYQRMLFASIGTTVTKYILNRRLELCKEGLQDSAYNQYNLTQLAYSYGFNDAAYFSRKFKEIYGISPKDFRHMNK